MLFNSLHFCIFFPLVTFLYFIVPAHISWLVLLIASCYFYMSWQPLYILLIALATVVHYGASIALEQSSSKQWRRIYVGTSAAVTLGLLFIFKYLDLLHQTFYTCLQWCGWGYGDITPFDIPLPVGISFFTFQTMSYTLDVFYGRQKAERNLGKCALFVTYFPQLVAGPIERAGNLLNQFHKRESFNYHNAVIGLRTFLGGMLLKVVVADNVAKYVDAVYNNVHDYVGWPLLFATYLFAFQIFCDFAGYSYMAIGIARVMGITLMENFAQPYMASSIKDFWRRWHISLSSWFCDYVYIPLGGSKVSFVRYQLNLMATFLLSGLWHGANWTFVVWGALNGFFLISALYIPSAWVRAMPRILRIFITFGAVCFSWIFFRANTLSDAWYILTHMLSGLGEWSTVLQVRRAVVMGRSFDVPLLLALTLAVWGVQCFQYYAGSIRLHMNVLSGYLRMLLYYCGITVLFLLGEFGGHQFIYFQF